MVLMDRDNQIIEFLNICPADSLTLQKIFFSTKRVCNERLKKLYEFEYIKRFRNNINSNYIYYVKRKPKQLNHCNYISKSYTWILEQGYNIEHFQREILLDNIRADAVYKIKDDCKSGFIITEVELSNNNTNKKVNKYEEFFITKQYKQYFNVMPKILYISNQNVNSDLLNIINLKLSDVE